MKLNKGIEFKLSISINHEQTTIEFNEQRNPQLITSNQNVTTSKSKIHKGIELQNTNWDREEVDLQWTTKVKVN